MVYCALFHVSSVYPQIKGNSHLVQFLIGSFRNICSHIITLLHLLRDLFKTTYIGPSRISIVLKDLICIRSEDDDCPFSHKSTAQDTLIDYTQSAHIFRYRLKERVSSKALGFSKFQGE